MYIIKLFIYIYTHTHTHVYIYIYHILYIYTCVCVRVCIGDNRCCGHTSVSNSLARMCARQRDLRQQAQQVVFMTYADVCWRILTYAETADAAGRVHSSSNTSSRMLTYADVCWRMLTYADLCWFMLTYADVCWRMLRLSRSCTLQHQHRLHPPGAITTLINP
jgi:hypothetical protein